MIFSWYDYKPATYGSYEYPTWGDAIGWIMTLVVILGIIITSIGMFFFVEGSFGEVSEFLLHYHFTIDDLQLGSKGKMYGLGAWLDSIQDLK